ncbi:MAG: M12 family metallo-peptidase, partial [Verrucomicrobiota bacterium]
MKKAPLVSALALGLMLFVSLTKKPPQTGPGVPPNALSTTPPSRTEATPESVRPTASPTVAAPVLEAIATGKPLRIQTADQGGRTLLFKPTGFLNEDFSIGLGPKRSLPFQARTFEGRAFHPGRNPEPVSLVQVGTTLTGLIETDHGDTLWIRSGDEGQTWALLRQPAPPVSHCRIGDDGRIASMATLGKRPPPLDWSESTALEMTPIAAQSGQNPISGRSDQFVNPIPMGERYRASLKEASLLLVLDKEATGSDSTSNLESKTSQYLAVANHVAAIYETQLGIHLTLQELILTPDSDDYNDIPTGADPLNSFRSWMSTHRPASRHKWSISMKAGLGLSGQTLGLAFVGTVGQSNAVGVIQPGTGWETLAHEMGHTLGSNHSSGGIMNATSLDILSRDFFKNVSPGETAAKDIFDRSRSRLPGKATLRHPEEMPFARDDFRQLRKGESLTFDPRENDLTETLNGLTNGALSVEEISPLIPSEAGSITLTGNHLTFAPAPDYEGPAWFSYTLRGSQGNNDTGWLHKAEVGLEIGSLEADPFSLTLTPGQSFSFFPPGGTRSRTQPEQGRLDRALGNGLLILRPDPDAVGSDSFRSGGDTYNITYRPRPLRTRPDIYLVDSRDGPFRFFPLNNDEGTGFSWPRTMGATLGTGKGEAHEVREPFGTSFRLLGAINLQNDKGTLTLREQTTNLKGEPAAGLTGEFEFTPAATASGKAIINYEVEDSQGNNATEQITLNFGGERRLLVGLETPYRYKIPLDDSDSDTWRFPDFPVNSWAIGQGILGYESTEGYEDLIE